MQKILYIEDEYIFREIFSIKLQLDLKVEVLVASSGNEGIKLIKEISNLSLIITDVSMNDGTGQDILNFLEDQKLSIPIVFFTSNIDFENGPQYEHFKGVVQKFNFDALLSLSKAALSSN